MKKLSKRFSIERETVRQLSSTVLAEAAGAGRRAGTGPVDSCETCMCPPATGAQN
jgi:hypothetical protein